MIIPFAINSAAVLIFRQYFLQLPRELFEAARIDGAGELKILGSVALPLVRPALVDGRAAHLHRTLERVPVAVPDHQAGRSAAAGGVAGQLHHQRGQLDGRTRSASIMAGAVVLAVPVVCSSWSSSATSSAPTWLRSQGMTDRTHGEPFPYSLTRCGVVMAPESGNAPRRSRGCSTPAPAVSDGEIYLLPRLVAEGNVSRVGLARVLVSDGVPSWRRATRGRAGARTGSSNAVPPTPAPRTRGSPGSRRWAGT